MNVTAAGHVPAHAHRQRPATQPEVTGDGSGPTDTAPVDGATESDDGARVRGGQDTPFTHALHQGNGKKLGILRRLPTPDDVAAEQTAAGLDPTGGETPVDQAAGDATPVDQVPAEGEAPAATVPAEGATPTDTIVIDGSSLGGLTGSDAPTTSELLSEAVAEAVASAEPSAPEPAEPVAVPEPTEQPEPSA